MDNDRLYQYLEQNIELTRQLERYNNMGAGLMFLSIFTVIILIIILIKTMGWL